MKIIGEWRHLESSYDKYECHECGCVFFVESNPNVHCPICGSYDLVIKYCLPHSNEDKDKEEN